MKTKFTTLEGLQKAFPIGSVLASWSQHQERFYYNEDELEAYRRNWDEVIILSDKKVFLKKNYCLKPKAISLMENFGDLLIEFGMVGRSLRRRRRKRNEL